jgi:butyrate kinase
LSVPYAYARRRVAQAWGVPPWVVDDAPVDEFLLELKLMEIEYDAANARL